MTSTKLNEEPFEIEFSNGRRALVTEEERDDLLKVGIRIKKEKTPYRKPTRQELTINASIRLVMALLVSIFFQSIQAGPWDWYDFAGSTLTIVAFTGFCYAVELWWNARSIKATSEREI